MTSACTAHAPARLRVQTCQRRPRHPGATALPRAQEHPGHGALYRAFARPLPGLLEGLIGTGRDDLGSPPAASYELLVKTLADSLRANCESWRGNPGWQRNHALT